MLYHVSDCSVQCAIGTGSCELPVIHCQLAANTPVRSAFVHTALQTRPDDCATHYTPQSYHTWCRLQCIVHVSVLTVDTASAVCVPVRCMVDGPLAKFTCVLHRKVPPVLRVQHTIRIRGARPHREDVVGQPGPIVVHVIQARALGVGVGGGEGRGKQGGIGRG